MWSSIAAYTGAAHIVAILDRIFGEGASKNRWKSEVKAVRRCCVKFLSHDAELLCGKGALSGKEPYQAFAKLRKWQFALIALLAKDELEAGKEELEAYIDEAIDMSIPAQTFYTQFYQQVMNTFIARLATWYASNAGEDSPETLADVLMFTDTSTHRGNEAKAQTAKKLNRAWDSLQLRYRAANASGGGGGGGGGGSAPVKTCHRCGQPGHVKRDCPQASGSGGGVKQSTSTSTWDPKKFIIGGHIVTADFRTEYESALKGMGFTDVDIAARCKAEDLSGVPCPYISQGAPGPGGKPRGPCAKKHPSAGGIAMFPQAEMEQLISKHGVKKTTPDDKQEYKKYQDKRRRANWGHW